MPEDDAPPPAAPRPEAPEASPPRRVSFIDRRWFTAERLQIIANVLTVVVAVAAIALSVWEGYENRLHNRLSVLPHLDSSISTLRDGPADSTWTMIYALENTGLGPAVLHSIRVFRDGALLFDGRRQGEAMSYGDVREDLRALPFPIVSDLTNELRVGEMLEARESHLLIRFEVATAESLGRYPPEVVRAEVMDRYSFVFCYCSVYGENCDVTSVSAPPPAGRVCEF